VNPFQAIFVPDSLVDALSDQAWLAALLEVERALANAQSLAGLIDAAEAAEVAEACDPSRFDAAELAENARPSGNPVIPLVHALRDAGATAAHRGATSQDILDSASMLVAKDALWIIDVELMRLADTCAELAEAHRTTVMAARTLLQQAVPTTFGLKAAGWLMGVLDARDALRELVDRLLEQPGGAAGTLAS